MKIFKSSETTSKPWSGGTTTELYIHPKDGNYQNRDFNFRLSTATVEVDSSVFTPLNGVRRTLMVLEGEMALSHQNHHKATLKPGNQDEFWGDWFTSSKGKCIDFNLMCQHGYSGTLTFLTLVKNSIEKVQLTDEFNYLYIYQGEIEIEGNVLEAGDFVHFDTEKDIGIIGADLCSLVLVNVNKV